MIADRRVGLEGALGVLAALAALALATPARAGNPGSGKISEELTATAAAPGARGRAVVIVRDSDLRLRVAARGLQRRTTHDVILDRVKIGTLSTSGRGNGRARFRSRPHGSPTSPAPGIRPPVTRATISSAAASPTTGARNARIGRRTSVRHARRH